MAYREAKTEKEKKRGKSTDELSLKEATAFFKKRGKEKGASKFRWRGDVYNLSGEKIGGKKAPTKTEAKSKASSSAPESTSTRPQARRTEGTLRSSSGGPSRYKPSEFSQDGGPRRGSRKPKTSSSNNPKAEKAKTKLLRSAGINYKTWEEMTRPERREVGLPETTVGWQNQSLINDPIGWMKKQLGLTAKIPSTGSSKRNQTKNSNYTQEDLDRRSGGRRTGMPKGGMVKSGNKDYKKSGMFYKSASPRGYK